MFKRFLVVLSEHISIQKHCSRCVRRGRNDSIVHLIKPRPGNSYIEEPEDLFVEDELENEIDNANVSSGRAKKIDERQEYRQFVKHKILERKEHRLNFPKEPNLLTWAARSQIKHLNRIDPELWTPRALAHSFPASEATILKILKSSRLPEDELEIMKHDRKVYRNWMKLNEAQQSVLSGGPQDAEYRFLVENGILSRMVNAAGVPDLPRSNKAMYQQTRKAIAAKRRPTVHSEFSSILHEYKAGQQKSDFSQDVQPIRFNDPETIQLLADISGVSPDNKTEEQSYNAGKDDAIDRLDHRPSRRERRLSKIKSAEMNSEEMDIDVSKVLKAKQLGAVKSNGQISRIETSDVLTSSSIDMTEFLDDDAKSDRGNMDILRRAKLDRQQADIEDVYPELTGTLDDIDILYKGNKHKNKNRK